MPITLLLIRQSTKFFGKRPQRFRDLTRYDELARVLEGIDAAAPLFPGLKIDTVVIRGVNDDELIDLLEFGRR